MAIRFTKFIDINSVVGAAAQVPQRQWCARIFTTSALVGPSAILQFTSAADVGDFFGTTSEEYQRAVVYFDYESVLGNAPVAIQYARWVEANQPATIYGEASIATLAALNAITAGVLSLKFGATTVNLTGLDFATDGTLAAVATTLQTALIAATAQSPNAELTACVVAFNATSPQTRQSQQQKRFRWSHRKVQQARTTSPLHWAGMHRKAHWSMAHRFLKLESPVSRALPH